MKLHLPIVPPTTTSQMKRLAFVGGKPRFFKSKQSMIAEASYEQLLIDARPAEKLVGPITLEVTFVFPHRKSIPKKLAGEMIPKTTRPDLDNSVKALVDSMTRTFWFNDDAEIFSLTVTKYHGPDERVGVWIDITGAA